jgi:hypothetical protein
MLEHVPQADQIEMGEILRRGCHLKEIDGYDEDADLCFHTSSRFCREFYSLYLPAVFPGPVEQATVTAAEIEEPSGCCDAAADKLVRCIIVTISTCVIVGGVNPLVGVLGLIQSCFEVQVNQVAVCTPVVAKLALSAVSVVKLQIISCT